MLEFGSAIIRSQRAEGIVVGAKSFAWRPPANVVDGSDALLDQIFTRWDLAAHYVGVCRWYFDFDRCLVVEPSAGDGSFYKELPCGTVAFDVVPRHPGILQADFLGIDIESDRPIAVVGNPPFGRNSNLAIRFVNRAATFAEVVAMVLPRTVRKAKTENRIDRNLHLVHEEILPKDAFLFRGKPKDVPSVFQIWMKRSEQRPLRLIETSHPDFEFTSATDADFAIQRVGMKAGLVHHDFSRSASCHYFIKGDVQDVMSQLDFASVAGDVAGMPSLGKAEIVALYRAFVAARASGSVPPTR